MLSIYACVITYCTLVPKSSQVDEILLLRDMCRNAPKTMLDLLNLLFKEPITETDSWSPWQVIEEMCVEKDGSVSKWDRYWQMICQLPDR